MNKRRKIFSGYSIFCICWSILSILLSVFSVCVRLFGNQNFNKVSSISILPGINAGTFIIASSIYFLIAAILTRRENKENGNMVFSSILAAILFICQSLVVVFMYSIHKINLRIYIQAIIAIPFLILPLCIMMTALPQARRSVNTAKGKRSFFTSLDKITKKKDISKMFKPKGSRRHR